MNNDNESTRALMATIDRLVAERDAAIARAIAAEARADAAEAREREIGEELDKATGMVEMHVDDAEAARMLWRQSEGACAFMDTQRAAAEARADAAERRESELGIQVVAQAARLRLAEAVVREARYGTTLAMRRALAAWDAVPGDQG